MTTGRVKWFDNVKGYGFIVPDQESEDVFVHYSAIDSDSGYKTLYKGDEVKFDVKEADKGLEADNVVIVKKAAHRGSDDSTTPLFNIQY